MRVQIKWLRVGLILLALIGSIVVISLEEPILGLDLRGGVMLLLQANPEDLQKLTPSERAQAIDEAVGIIRLRVNESGLAETFVSKAGEDRIWVEIPCPAPPEPCTRPEVVRNLIERRGYLEFKKVLKVGSPDEELVPGPFEEVVYDQDGVPYLVPVEPLLTGAEIVDARAQPSPNVSSGPFVVLLTFTEEGAKRFAELLRGGTLKEGDRLAIILDGAVQSAPSIAPSLVSSARSGGWRSIRQGTQITNLPTLEEATQLAIVLRSGNLPVRLKAILEESIGPSLGQDSINKGMLASIVAGALVLLFMLIYYRFAGLIADLVLGLNLLMLIAAMMLLGATWTLPGIAGLILTIGMGVDSNVLIFERVREELRAGKSVRAAIDFGYDRALLTIIDSHVTTLITALILFTFGTGPIKGFATTLSIGIVINLFTALMGTRLAFDLIKEREPRRLSI
jgi:preprotein translocase subunit SecD